MRGQRSLTRGQPKVDTLWQAAEGVLEFVDHVLNAHPERNSFSFQAFHLSGIIHQWDTSFRTPDDMRDVFLRLKRYFDTYPAHGWAVVLYEQDDVVQQVIFLRRFVSARR